ncbi:SPFH domain-containing protein [Pedobacter africanus]|uniref:Membrane protease subunit, stomatin/prohibitin family, contains C-terminal Zn-ribbon domain n=1 Tax=Pedobacter africanus TaxID=151894 RepID=A0A1W2DLK2_9SPHI|nr:SPFH domain-containing protein [Pedobacter africanus]SMC97932.1 Membrane protease subunit, stomatin/prohibitin family, contains C-terminal Zn-ribbon domain [Pedobacter africanus]
MGLGDFFKKQLSTVIEWKDQQPELLLYKFPAPTDEVKNASKLIVAPGQGCILVYEGEIKGFISDEGLFDLQTDNHPFITNLLKLRQLFESEHKLRIYFYRKADILNQPWGTPSPVKYLDGQYHIPVELGAYGNYSMRIADPLLLFRDIIGSRNEYTTADTKALLLSRLPQTLISYLAQSKLSYLDIDAQLDRLSSDLKAQLNAGFSDLGLELKDFRIQGTSFDKETQQRIGKIADITAESRAAAEGGLSYLEIEKLKALRDAARNEAGLAGAGLQLGFGMDLGKTLNDKKEELTAYSTTTDPVVQLQKLKLLLDEDILTQEEFDAKKKEILSKM